MWARIEAVTGDRPNAWLPADLAEDCNGIVSLVFGLRQVRVRVGPDPEATEASGSSVEHPVRILVTKRVLKDLLVRENVTYKVCLTGGRIEIGPLIGFLLGNQTHKYSPRYMEKFSDRLGVCRRIGGVVCAFSSETVDWKRKTAYGLIYSSDHAKWEFAQFPLPSAVYRRNFHSGNRSIDRLKGAGVSVFNSRRFLKPEVYDIVRASRRLAKYIPPTEIVSTYSHLKAFIDAHERVILKPTDLSRGRGICFVEKHGRAYVVTDYRGRDPIERHVGGDNGLCRFFQRNRNLFTRYLVQRLLPLARVDGRLFDIRVVMQKSQSGEWECTGIECRVGGPGMMVTNISRGGTAMPLEQALEESLGPGDHTSTIREVHALSSKVCAAMDDTAEHFAEFGLDLGLDVDGRLWLIEANVFPSFKGFRVMDPAAYVRIRQAPLLYASAVAGFSPSGGANDNAIPGDTGVCPGPIDNPQ